MFSASRASSARRCVAIDQPTTRRLNTSMTMARNTKPVRVGTQGRSATHSRVGGAGLEATLDEVRGGPCGGVPTRRACRPAPRHARQAHLSHQPSHAIGIRPGPLRRQARRGCEAPHTGAAAALVNGADARLEALVALLAPRRLAGAPRMAPARGDTEHSGHRGDTVAGLIRSDELERLAGTESASRANPGRGFCQYLALFAQPAVLTTNTAKLLALGARQPVVEVGPRRGRPGRTQLRPVTNGPVRALELAGELSNRASRAGQLHHLMAKLGRVWQVGSRHRGFSFPKAKGFGIHQSGSTLERPSGPNAWKVRTMRRILCSRTSSVRRSSSRRCAAG